MPAGWRKGNGERRVRTEHQGCHGWPGRRRKTPTMFGAGLSDDKDGWAEGWPIMTRPVSLSIRSGKRDCKHEGSGLARWSGVDERPSEASSQPAVFGPNSQSASSQCTVLCCAALFFCSARFARTHTVGRRVHGHGDTARQTADQPFDIVIHHHHSSSTFIIHHSSSG